MNHLEDLINERGISIRDAAKSINISHSTIVRGIKRPVHWQVILLLELLSEVNEKERSKILKKLFSEILGVDK